MLAGLSSGGGRRRRSAQWGQRCFGGRSSERDCGSHGAYWGLLRIQGQLSYTCSRTFGAQSVHVCVCVCVCVCVRKRYRLECHNPSNLEVMHYNKWDSKLEKCRSRMRTCCVFFFLFFPCTRSHPSLYSTPAEVSWFICEHQSACAAEPLYVTMADVHTVKAYSIHGWLHLFQ